MDPHHSQIRARERKNEVIPSERNVIVIAGQLVVEKGKLSVPATQPRLFPFKLLLADEGEERGEERTGGGIGSLVRFHVQVLGFLPLYPQTLQHLIQ